jgi:2-polyprenyl-6-methoxyphenol hydroxylase-like FAD-dependent oxidoreductase
MTPTIATTCCVVGGGPAGMMLGYLLARHGVPVTVIEKHEDFFRDFRGDTIHPSTLQIIYELGLLEDFLKLPHQELQSVGGMFGNFPFQAADFRYVPARCKFVALMPQWDFLDFLSNQAKKFPHFDLRMQHEAIGLTSDAGRITGVEVRTPNGTGQIQADLVVGCDGRHSSVRRAAQLDVLEFGVPIDVLWFRVSRQENDPEQLFGIVNYGRALVLINRGTYFQAGLIIQKGSFPQLQSGGMDAFRQMIQKMAPYLGERIHELKDWDQIKLLTVQINRLRRWYRPGLLCIGDAAHAMSPAGGIGINLAIQDAVAAANLLAQPLREGCIDDALLGTVQQRREFPTRVTQFLQINAHRALARVFQDPGPVQAPWQFKLALRVPGAQRVTGRIVGIGIRPEHIVDAPRRTEFREAAVRTLAVCATLAVLAVVGVCAWRKSAQARSSRNALLFAPVVKR